MELDLEAETNELRQRSPMSSRRVLIAGSLTILLTLTFLGIGFFVPDVWYSNNWWTIFAVAGIVFVMGGLFVFAFWRQAKILIETGEVVKATLISVIPMPKSTNRVTVRYVLNGQSHEKSFTMYDYNCQAVQRLGHLMIAASPKSPELVEPLYVFARNGTECRGIIEGKHGLSRQN